MQQRVSLYVRVSTIRQAQTQTIEQQIERLKEYVRVQDWGLDETVVRPILGTIC